MQQIKLSEIWLRIQRWLIVNVIYFGRQTEKYRELCSRCFFIIQLLIVILSTIAVLFLGLSKKISNSNKEKILNQEKNCYCYKEDEIRFVICDIAIATGESNDLTCIICGNINTNNGKITQEYITTYSGLNSVEQSKRMKRIFYEYKATYFVMDSKGLGNAIFDILTQETYDDEYGMKYPAWTVNTDKDLQISSDVVINDKIARTISTNAKNVIIPFAGTAEINSMMHLTTRKMLRDNTISLLIDDYDKRAKLENADPNFILKSSFSL